MQPLEESDICHTLPHRPHNSHSSKRWETHKVDAKHQKLLGIALSDGQTDKQGFFMSGFSNCFLDETNQICNNNKKATLPQKKIQLHASLFQSNGIFFLCNWNALVSWVHRGKLPPSVSRHKVSWNVETASHNFPKSGNVTKPPRQQLLHRNLSQAVSIYCVDGTFGS